MKLSENLILPNRNVIINGDMSIAQRGTGPTLMLANSNEYATVDRWRPYHLYGLSSLSMQVEQINVNVEDFSKAHRIECLSTGKNSNSWWGFQQRIENQVYLKKLGFNKPNRKLTISFWCRSSKTGNFAVALRTLIPRVNIKNVSILSADTWEKKVITMDVDNHPDYATENLFFELYLDGGSGYRQGPVVSGWHDYDSANIMTDVTLNLSETQGATFDLTGVQLEAGDVATPFEHLPYQENLNRCWRYYYPQNAWFLLPALHHNTLGRGLPFSYPVPMRIVPDLTIISLSQVSAPDENGSYSTTSNYNMYFTSTHSTNSGFVKFSMNAEL